MLRKFCAFMAFVGITCFAMGAENLPQVTTSEVFYDYNPVNQGKLPQVATSEVFYDYAPVDIEDCVEDVSCDEMKYVEPVVQRSVPAWPLVGSDADVNLVCDDSNGCYGNDSKIVTKVGSGLVIENNIVTHGAGWSGGPDIINGRQVPAGFDDECENNAEMPLLTREMLEDDGGSVLAVSRSGRKKCDARADSYAVFAERAGFTADKTCDEDNNNLVGSEREIEVAMNEYKDEEAPAVLRDQVHSWVVASGQTLRQVLQSWCDKEGWDLVWTTSREYPIEASAIFKGRFVDVASALIRNFERATPIPYAKFYKGNRVIVVSTSEE